MVKQVSGQAPPDREPPKREGAVRKVKFIMDRLREDGKTEYTKLMTDSEKFRDESVQKFKRSQGITTSIPYVDPALKAPWLEAKERADILKTQGEPQASLELDWIKDHVGHAFKTFKEWKRKFAKEPSFTSPRKGTPGKGKAASSDKAARGARDSVMQKLAMEFSSMPTGKVFLTRPESEIRLLRASYGMLIRLSSNVFRL